MGRGPDTIPINVYGIVNDLDLLKRYRNACTVRAAFNLLSESSSILVPLANHFKNYINDVKCFLCLTIQERHWPHFFQVQGML